MEAQPGARPAPPLTCRTPGCLVARSLGVPSVRTPAPTHVCVPVRTPAPTPGLLLPGSVHVIERHHDVPRLLPPHHQDDAPLGFLDQLHGSFNTSGILAIYGKDFIILFDS